MRITDIVSATAALFGFCAALAAQQPCSVSNIRGTWAMTASGWAIPLAPANSPAAPVASIGAFTIDYAGRLMGSGSISWATGIAGTNIAAGDVLDFDMVDGSVDLNPDCTGIWRYSVKLKGMPALTGYVERIVVVPQKDEIVFLSIRSPLSKPMWVGTAKRISPVPSTMSWPPAPQ
jgi:hypothetical protein